MTFINAAQFLIDRLDDFERGSLSDDIEAATRDFAGHVTPAIERLRALTDEAREAKIPQSVAKEFVSADKKKGKK